MQSYLPLPISLTLGFSAVYWMAFEMLYAAVSVKKGKGDFGKIAINGKGHLGLATSALIFQCAIGIFTATKIVK